MVKSIYLTLGALVLCPAVFFRLTFVFFQARPDRSKPILFVGLERTTNF